MILGHPKNFSNCHIPKDPLFPAKIQIQNHVHIKRLTITLSNGQRDFRTENVSKLSVILMSTVLTTFLLHATNEAKILINFYSINYISDQQINDAQNLLNWVISFDVVTNC